jgi:hypothetical protein
VFRRSRRLSRDRASGSSSVIIAFLFLFIGIEHESDHAYWNIIMMFFSWLLFLMLTAYSTNIQIPYEMYNASSGKIESGFHIYYTGDLLLVYFSFFIATFAYFFDLMFHQQLIKLFKRG